MAPLADLLNAELLDDVDFAATLANPRFTELHERTIDRPIAEVWPACVELEAAEVNVLAPLAALRGLPKLVRGARPELTGGNATLIELFTDEGFVLIRCDRDPRGGEATIIVGAAGEFWKPVGNQPKPFESPQAFIDFAEPGYAKTVARLTAVDLGGGRTRVETETWVAGTDAAATRKFAPYWALIRLPSGLIRRSWLAAIERRVKRR